MRTSLATRVSTTIVVRGSSRSDSVIAAAVPVNVIANTASNTVVANTASVVAGKTFE